MKVDTYMCTNCYEPQIFKPNDDNPHVCKKCGKEMEYWCTEEIDTLTGKVINRENDNGGSEINVNKIVTGRPIVTCPYCKSTNTKPISGAERAISIIGLGILSKKINKSYKCLECKCTW